MKLYIPTCTLNFNNILSSESISPLGFYARRGFGNKRYYSVCANDKESAIILYNKYPRFKVEDKDIENYPMVIAIESNDYKDGFFEMAKEEEGVEIYLCYNTINLNPFHCRIYLNSFQERQGVLSKAEQSLENKFYKLYAANIEVKPEENKSSQYRATNLFSLSEEDDFVWSPSYSDCKIKSESIDVSNDVLQDRIKGFIYCYIIGANCSVSNEIGKLKAIARKLRNTLSAVVNSPNKTPTNTQNDAIMSSIKEFNEIYSSIDEDTISNKKVIDSHLSNNPLGLSVKEVEKLLQYFGLFDALCNRLHLRRVYDANDLWRCLKVDTQETYTRAIDSMNTAILRLELKDKDRREKVAIDSLINVDENLSLQILDSSYKHPFYGKLVCSQLNAEYKDIMEKQESEEPLAQAFNGGKILKDMLGKNWESKSVSKSNNISVSEYINGLLRHFQENSAFDLFAINNDVLTSFAAFCQKGDNIDRLVEYLVQTGFCNYKLAYGLYGATRGFTSLPKTFTSSLINGDKEYYQSFASKVWRMLNGVEVTDAVLPKANSNASVTVESQLGYSIIENINNVESNVTKQQKLKEAIIKASELEDAVQSPKAFMYILDSFPHVTTTKAYKALAEVNFAENDGSYTPDQFRIKIYSIVGKDGLKTQKENIDKAIELEAKRQDPEAFLKVLDNFLKPSDTAYKKIVKLIESRAETQKNVQKKQWQNENNKKNTVGSVFVYDDNCWNLLQHMVPKSLKDKFRKDLKWFQDEYKKGKESVYYASASRENNDSILSFIRYIKRKKYSKEMQIKDIEDYLKKMYV